MSWTLHVYFAPLILLLLSPSSSPAAPKYANAQKHATQPCKSRASLLIFWGGWQPQNCLFWWFMGLGNFNLNRIPTGQWVPFCKLKSDMCGFFVIWAASIMLLGKIRLEVSSGWLQLPGTIRIVLGKIFETDELTDVRLRCFQRYDSRERFPQEGTRQNWLT